MLLRKTKLTAQATFASSQGSRTHLCPPGDRCGRSLPRGLLCHPPFESPRPGSCRKELLLKGVCDVQFFPCESCFSLSLRCCSCLEIAGSLSWVMVLGGHVLSLLLQPPCALRWLARSVLHRDAGWHSKTPPANIF